MGPLDPSPFSTEAVDPETLALTEIVEKALAGSPAISEVQPAVLRAQREAGEGPWGAVETVEAAEVRRIRAGGLEIPIRVLVPDNVRGVYLHIHGGGFSACAIGTSTPTSERPISSSACTTSSSRRASGPGATGT